MVGKNQNLQVNIDTRAFLFNISCTSYSEKFLEPFHETIFSAMPVNGATRAQSETYDWRIERLASGQNKNELDLKASRRRLLAQKGYNMADIDEKDPEYDDGVVLTSTSRVLVHTFDELGLHHITMVNKANDGDSPLVAEFFVKYVRKELHSIDDEDREKVSNSDGSITMLNKLVSQQRLEISLQCSFIALRSLEGTFGAYR